MPPDPVLAVIAMVGFMVYLAIGSVVAATAIKRLGDSDHTNALAKRKFSGQLGDYRSSHYAGNVWALFFLLSVMWPVVVGATLIAGLGFCLFYGPVWLTIHTGSYVANIGSEKAA